MMQEKLAVYGTGVIGACQATLIIGHGIPVVAVGHSEQGLVRCRRTIEQNWDDLIENGLATEKNKEAAMKLLTLTRDPAALAGCTFVFEAVAESEETKKAVYETVCEYAAENAVIASCSSSINADILAKLTPAPEHLLIAHPFQPVHMLPLVELVMHDTTASSVTERAKAVLEMLHRKVVTLQRSVPGFLVNRLAQALFRESLHLIETGVTTAEDIDCAVKYAVGMRYASIGLLEYYDAVGFDLESTIAKNVYPDLCSRTDTEALVLDGLRTGVGLYDWSKKDADDFRLRKQSPYFDTVREWTLPI